MSTKEEVLQYIKEIAEQKIISREELDTAFDSGGGVKTDVVLTKKIGIAEILYYIGGGVVFLGISILVWQNWSTLNTATKILATLGSGIAAYIVGLIFSRDIRTEAVGSAFYLISALVMPIGVWVVFENAGLDSSSQGFMSLISGIMFITFLLSFLVFKKTIFTLFSILFGTSLFFTLTNLMVEGGVPFNLEDGEYSQYRIFIVGIVYMLLGYAFSKDHRAPLRGFLYNFGVLGFLGSALALGGWEPNQNIFWELIFILLVFAVLFLSVHIKSKAFLIWGTIFLMGYILKITAEYFSTGLGWPLALVIAGLAMIGVGYMSVSLNKKYLST